jgi:predicted acyltransferase
VLGILWISWVGSLLAVVFGHVALRQIPRNNEAGRGLAIAGLVLGYVGLGFLALFIIAAFASIASFSGP